MLSSRRSSHSYAPRRAPKKSRRCTSRIAYAVRGAGTKQKRVPSQEYALDGWHSDVHTATRCRKSSHASCPPEQAKRRHLKRVYNVLLLLSVHLRRSTFSSTHLGSWLNWRVLGSSLSTPSTLRQRKAEGEGGFKVYVNKNQ